MYVYQEGEGYGVWTVIIWKGGERDWDKERIRQTTKETPGDRMGGRTTERQDGWEGRKKRKSKKERKLMSYKLHINVLINLLIIIQLSHYVCILVCLDFLFVVLND